MARLSKELVDKREKFLRTIMEKAKKSDETVTLSKAHEAMTKEFGAKTPKMAARRVYDIRDEVFGKGHGRRPRKGKTAAPTSAARRRGPKSATAKKPTRTRSASNGNGADSSEGSMFVIHGSGSDLKKLLAAAKDFEINVEIDEAATQAITALRATA